MQINDKPGEVISPVIPQGDNLVIKRCPNATINLAGQVITGRLIIVDSPGITVQGERNKPCSVIADPDSAAVSVRRSPKAVVSYIHTFGDPRLFTDKLGYLKFTVEDWKNTGVGLADSGSGVKWFRCSVFGARIGASIVDGGSIHQCLIQGIWGDGIRLLGPNTKVTYNKVYDLFKASALHNDLIQSYQDVGATVPWDNILVYKNILDGTKNESKGSVTPFCDAQGIFFGRGPYGKNISIRENTINCRAYRAISVPDGTDVRIENNKVLYQFPNDPRYPFIQNNAQAGTVVNNIIATVHVQNPGVLKQGNTKIDGSPSRGS